MCSIIFSSKQLDDLEYINRVTKFRGPDLTTHKILGGFNYVHNLLSITGEITSQPFTIDDVVCIYNGEIYNYKEFGEFKSDGECIIPAYKKYGIEFTKHLDGEFAIVLVDYVNNTILVSSDTFKTKPLFYSVNENNLHIGVASYSEPLYKIGFQEVKKFPPNKTMVFDIKTKSKLIEFDVVTFDVSNQNKTSMNDWYKTFEKSIKKRTENLREKLFIGLSSGYDSGAICCELLKQKIDFKTYTIRGSENEEVILKRLILLIENNTQYSLLKKSDTDLLNSIEHIKNNTEEFKYTICSSSSDYNEFDLSLTDDNGSKYLSYVCKRAKEDNYKIMLSGVGPDEIYSDYGFNGNKVSLHSNFGGLFPNDLKSIFPWNSFFNSSMESYIAKEEYVGGSYGIEVRYPFLDKNLVQEFLWLDVNLKNKSYKYPLEYYLEINDYPFEKGKKLGF